MRLRVSSFIIAEVRQCCQHLFIFVNTLYIVLLLFSIVGLNIILLYIEFIRFVINPNSSVTTSMTTVIGLDIAHHSISRLGSRGFHISLWDASNRVIIWFAKIILNILILIISIESIGIFSDGIYSRILYLTLLIHLFSQCEYLFSHYIQRFPWAIYIQFTAILFIKSILHDISLRRMVPDNTLYLSIISY